jgi:hypothetical protein
VLDDLLVVVCSEAGEARTISVTGKNVIPSP